LFLRAHEQKSNKTSDPSGFDFKVDTWRMNLTDKWVLTVTGDSKETGSVLKHRPEDYVQVVTYLPTAGGVILYVEYGDGDSAGGMVFKLQLPSGRVAWRTKVPTFNIMGMLQGDDLFVTGIGVWRYRPPR